MQYMYCMCTWGGIRCPVSRGLELSVLKTLPACTLYIAYSHAGVFTIRFLERELIILTKPTHVYIHS